MKRLMIAVSILIGSALICAQVESPMLPASPSGLTAGAAAGLFARLDTSNQPFSGTVTVSGTVANTTRRLFVGPASTLFSASVQSDLFAGSLGGGMFTGKDMPGPSVGPLYAIHEVTAARTDIALAFSPQMATSHNAGVVDHVIADGALTYHIGTGTVTLAEPFTAAVYNGTTGTITNGSGVTGGVFNLAAGTITNARALRALTGSNPSGTITNNYGLYLDSQAGVGTNNWLIFGDASGTDFQVRDTGQVSMNDLIVTSSKNKGTCLTAGGPPAVCGAVTVNSGAVCTCTDTTNAAIIPCAASVSGTTATFSTATAETVSYTCL